MNPNQGQSTVTIIAKTGILRVPEHYSSMAATGLPHRPRLVFLPSIPTKYNENINAPVQELGIFAKLLNQATYDQLTTTTKDKNYRLFSRLKLSISWAGDKLVVQPTSGTLTQRIESDFGVERTPIGVFTPPPLEIVDLALQQVSATQFKFGWLAMGRPHPASEVLFEEVCHRDCVYIWHRVGGFVTLNNGQAQVKVGFSGSRFPTHVLFINGKLAIRKYQGALGNLWVSEPANIKRVTSAGPPEHIVFSGFGGGSFGGGGSGGDW